MTISEKKAAARKEYIALRNGLGETRRAEASKSICEKILQLAISERADTVLLFYPIKGEPDLTPLVESLNRQNICVGFPISNTDKTLLDFRKVKSTLELACGAYGIHEPKNDAPIAEISSKSLCVVPALAFDRQGCRLGYGKGYYDRFLASFKGKSIGAVFDELLVDELPMDKYDISVDMIITEGGVISPYEKNSKSAHPEKENGR